MRALAIVTGLLSLVNSSVAISRVFESLRAVPSGWTQLGAPPPDTRIHLRIALKKPNHDLFEKTLLDVSSPDHPRYGQHLKREDLKAMLRPNAESTNAVLSWLEESGVSGSDIENDGDWIHFYVSIATANSMMSTNFQIYGNSVNNAEKIRALHYSVPADVAEHITMIQPTTRFGQVRPQKSNIFEVAAPSPAASLADYHHVPGKSLNVTACNATITPDCLRALYKIGDYQADPAPGSLFGVCGYLEEYAKFDELQTFLDKYAAYAAGENFTYTLINDGLLTQNNASLDDGEANLDIQYAVSLSYKVPVNYYSTGGRGILVPDLDQPVISMNSNEPYLDFLHYILQQDVLPQTITTSYGEDEQSVPASYAQEVCSMFGQLGARGVSVSTYFALALRVHFILSMANTLFVFSSGDTGVASACQTNDGKNTTRFLPIFPAACPYVTSVGATRYVEPEVAVSFSSGGFSDLFPRPDYQNQAVREFFEYLGDTWKGLYNPNGRGFPDVAAQGVRFHVIDKNGGPAELDLQFSGTSASAPTFASIIALLNNARLSTGLPPLGFLNPWIYSTGRHAMNDIVNGGSTGCTGVDQYSGLPTPFVPGASWKAVKGWDPVTGYGTPDFERLLNQVAPNAVWNDMKK